MKNKYLILFSFIFAQIYSFAQLNEFSLEKNLDSLMNLSFVKSNVNKYTLQSIDTTLVGQYFSQKINTTFFKNLPDKQLIRNRVNQLVSMRNLNLKIVYDLYSQRKILLDKVFKTNNIPDEFIAILWSTALFPKYQSTLGCGYWNMRYEIASRYDLEVNSLRDTRNDFLISTSSFANFYNDFKLIYEQPILSFASWVLGPKNILKAYHLSGEKTEFESIFPYIPNNKSSLYEFAAIYFAVNYMGSIQKANDFKFQIPQSDTVMLSHKIHIHQIATILSIDKQDFRERNPIYRTNIIHPGLKASVVCLPQGFGTKFTTLFDSIYSYRRKDYFVPVNQVGKSGSASLAYIYTNLSTLGKSGVYYTVKQGDDISLIAACFNVKVAELRYWNSMKRTKLSIGKKLIVYVPKKKAKTYKKINTMTMKQKETLSKRKSSNQTVNTIQKNTSISDTTKTKSTKQISTKTNANKTKSTTNENTGEWIYHTIKEGDSWWTIGQKYGVDYKEIQRLNNFKKGDHLKKGAKLKIKRKS